VSDHSESSTVHLARLLAAAKGLAKEYYALTGRPLGVTGEVAEYEAVRLLGLELADVRQPGYDALRWSGDTCERLQIKGRCVLDASKSGQKIGSIRLRHDWDAVLLVLLDVDFEATAIYEATRDAIHEALTAPGSKARNERGALSISKFKSIGRLIWRGTQGEGRSGGLGLRRDVRQNQEPSMPRECACGCGEQTAGGTFRPGHDSQLRASAERRAGGVIRLARLVDAAEAYARGELPLELLGERVRTLIPKPDAGAGNP
jgi:hypothetical protein